jgi:hypothetical protein
MEDSSTRDDGLMRFFEALVAKLPRWVRRAIRGASLQELLLSEHPDDVAAGVATVWGLVDLERSSERLCRALITLDDEARLEIALRSGGAGLAQVKRTIPGTRREAQRAVVKALVAQRVELAAGAELGTLEQDARRIMFLAVLDVYYAWRCHNLGECTDE